jgi:hypothetical protein
MTIEYGVTHLTAINEFKQVISSNQTLTIEEKSFLSQKEHFDIIFDFFSTDEVCKKLFLNNKIN